MKTFLLTTVASLFAASAAFAQEFSAVDIDDSGSLSLEEVQVVDPDVTQADFDLYDFDADGEWSELEYDAFIASRDAADEAPVFDETPAFDDPETPAFDDPATFDDDWDAGDVDEPVADPDEPY